MRFAAVLVLACAGTSSATAHADSAKIGEARTALAKVHYDEAQRLLVAAIKEGNNSAAAMREIYELSARTQVVLGHADAGEQYYRRWLALDPNATLADSVSPKLREPFVAAQADMAAKGAIAVSATRIDASTIDVAVISDPLAMARGGCSLAGGETIAFDAKGHARLTSTELRVAVCDESNNRLVEVNVTLPAVETPPPTMIVARPIATDAAPDAMHRPSTWWIIGGVTGFAALTCLGLEIQKTNDEPPTSSTGLIVGASVTGGVAIAAFVYASILHFGTKTQVTATPTNGGAAISFSGRF